MLKICFIVPVPPPYGGIANWTQLMCNYITNVRTDVELSVINIAPKTRRTEGRNLWNRIVDSGLDMLKQFRELNKVIKNKCPDVIHITTSGQFAVIRDILLLKAAERIQHINSSIHTKTYSQLIDSSNALEIIQGVQVVVDALDNISTRFILEKACRQIKIPLIHGAVNGFNGQVSTIFPEDKGFEVIYGSPQGDNRQSNIGRFKVSVPSVTPSLIASYQVAEVIKVLLNRGKPLRNKLLLINLEEMDWNVVEI